MKKNSLRTAVVLLIGLLSAVPARAELSEGVQKKLAGQLLLASQAISTEGESDADVVASIKKQAQHTLTSDGGSWHIAFLAFLSKKPGASDVSVDFYKGKTFVAAKRLAGISPSLTLLSSDFDITEDDGVSRGQSYTVKLTATVKKKEVVLATAQVTLK